MTTAQHKGDTRGLRAWHHIANLPEFPLDYKTTALIVIDMQYGQVDPDFNVFKRLREAGLDDDAEYARERIHGICVPNIARLAENFRANGAPVIFTVVASLRGDGSDQTWRHRQFGLIAHADSRDAAVLDELRRQPEDPLLVKTGSSIFNSTNVEHLLRNMGVTTLVMTGVWTNSCVETATRDAGDRDFRVVLAEDCCSAMSPWGDDTALRYLDKNFCHVFRTDEIIERLGHDSAQE